MRNFVTNSLYVLPFFAGAVLVETGRLIGRFFDSRTASLITLWSWPLALLVFFVLAWYVPTPIFRRRFGPFGLAADGASHQFHLSRAVDHVAVHVVDPADPFSWVQLSVQAFNHFSEVSVSASRPYASVYSTRVESASLGDRAEVTLTTATGKACRVRLTLTGFQSGPDRSRELPLPRVFTSFACAISAEMVHSTDSGAQENSVRPENAVHHGGLFERPEYVLRVGDEPLEVRLTATPRDREPGAYIRVQHPTNEFAWAKIHVFSDCHFRDVSVVGDGVGFQLARAGEDGPHDKTMRVTAADGTPFDVSFSVSDCQVGRDPAEVDPYPAVFHSLSVSARAREAVDPSQEATTTPDKAESGDDRDETRQAATIWAPSLPQKVDLVANGDPVRIELEAAEWKWGPSAEVRIVHPLRELAWAKLNVQSLQHFTGLRVWGPNDVIFRADAGDAQEDASSVRTIPAADGTMLEVHTQLVSFHVGRDPAPEDPYPLVFRSAVLQMEARDAPPETVVDESPPAGMGATGECDVFIAHASEDKTEVVRPLAEALRARDLSVWVDETELLVGETLVAALDRGLLHSRRGITVLSPSFFAKPWPQRELSAMAAKMEEPRAILPVWHNVSKEDVAAHSPILAGIIAATTADGIDAVADQLCKSIRQGQS